jgi:uncharacterized OB-fold protein
MITPVTYDRDTGGFFEAAAEGRLVFKCCEKCDRANHPPTPHCPICGHDRMIWKPSAGRAKVYNWTTVHQQFHPDYQTPYTVAMVTLDDAPEVRLAAFFDGIPDLAPDQPMEVWFDRRADGTTLPMWRPVEE